MSYECDGTYDLYKETIVKARKQHKCCACALPILPGHYYCRVFTIADGDPTTYIRCGACQKTHEHLRAVCRASDPFLWPDERLACGLDYLEEWCADPPEDIQAMPLLSAAERGALLQPKVKHETSPSSFG